MDLNRLNALPSRIEIGQMLGLDPLAGTCCAAIRGAGLIGRIIRRSSRFDERYKGRRLCYTSIIVDALKPHADPAVRVAPRRENR